MRHTILYTSDVHGNEKQLENLLKQAERIKPSTIIVAGEIAPKKAESPEKYILQQNLFVNESLPHFAQKVKHVMSQTQLYIGLGNDDAAVLIPLLEQHEQRGLFKLLNKRHALTPERDIMGYWYVPITPFGIKDWEKYDLSRPTPEQAQTYEQLKQGYNLSGYKSSKYGWSEFAFTPHLEQRDSIQNDLEQPRFTNNAKNTLYVMHTPPHNTPLDIIMAERHVGSLAVRSFIERHQPLATLHGHIHETVDMSGKYKTRIGTTFCMSAGNHNVGDQVAALVFDLDAPERAQRTFFPEKRSIFSFFRE